jgi:hypothetical protein
VRFLTSFRALWTSMLSKSTPWSTWKRSKKSSRRSLLRLTPCTHCVSQIRSKSGCTFSRP